MCRLTHIYIMKKFRFVNDYTGAPLFFFLSAFEVKVIQNITPKAAFTSTADKLFQTTGAYKYDLVHHKQCLVWQTYLKPPVHVQEYFFRKCMFFRVSSNFIFLRHPR